MSEMLKRVMDAIAPGCFTEQCDDADRHEIEMMARRAIEAMREPTEKMRHAACAPQSMIDAGVIWRVMIDECLKS